MRESVNEVSARSPRKERRAPVEKKTNRAAVEAQKNLIKEMTGGGVLADMMNETLESGRAEQFAQESETTMGPSGGIEQAIFNKSPDEIFGDEVVSQWASLAFNGMNVPDE